MDGAKKSLIVPAELMHCVRTMQSAFHAPGQASLPFTQRSRDQIVAELQQQGMGDYDSFCGRIARIVSLAVSPELLPEGHFARRLFPVPVHSLSEVEVRAALVRAQARDGVFACCASLDRGDEEEISTSRFNFGHFMVPPVVMPQSQDLASWNGYIVQASAGSFGSSSAFSRRGVAHACLPIVNPALLGASLSEIVDIIKVEQQAACESIKAEIVSITQIKKGSWLLALISIMWRVFIRETKERAFTA